tara:strand:- start:75 stop:572 length:498 start_codon:yes stop_codon:yes gene_type:complete
MSEQNMREKLVMDANTDTIVELMFDNHKDGINSYGKPYFLYGVKHQNVEKSIFATPKLHEQLRHYGKGDIVNIRKEEWSPGKTKFNVMPQENISPKTAVNGRSADLSNDARTHDIHKQVCFKEAMALMPKNGQILSDTELVVVETNMKNLLMVLEGRNAEEDTPF